VVNLYLQWLVPLMSNHSPLLYTRAQATPNARGEPPPEAQAEPKLEAIGSSAMFG
jgi:hypothetical protein